MAASEDQSISALAQLNNSTLQSQPGQSFPVVTLKDGYKVPTGTVGALLVNIRAYDEAHAAGDSAKMEELAQSFAAAVPVLKKVGLFDLFGPEEWEQGGELGKFGRQRVGQIALSLEKSENEQ